MSFWMMSNIWNMIDVYASDCVVKLTSYLLDKSAFRDKITFVYIVTGGWILKVKPGITPLSKSAKMTILHKTGFIKFLSRLWYSFLCVIWWIKEWSLMVKRAIGSTNVPCIFYRFFYYIKLRGKSNAGMIPRGSRNVNNG